MIDKEHRLSIKIQHFVVSIIMVSILQLIQIIHMLNVQVPGTQSHLYRRQMAYYSTGHSIEPNFVHFSSGFIYTSEYNDDYQHHRVDNINQYIVHDDPSQYVVHEDPNNYVVHENPNQYVVHDTRIHHYESSCHSQPSILMNPHHNEPTCRASHSQSQQPYSEVQAPLKAGANIPHLSQYATKSSSDNSNVESFPLIQQQIPQYENSLMGAIRHYWREVSGLCLASAIFLNWLFVTIKRSFIRRNLSRSDQAIESNRQTTATRSSTRDTNSSSAHDSAFEETASPISLDEIETSRSLSDSADKSTVSEPALLKPPGIRQRSSTLKAEPIPIPKSPGHNSLSTSLSNSLNTSEYNSRYSTDFDSIRRLGRGGFGIVFEAKNKIDDCHYAVKRICLPLEKEARERVMREVRALAKLDHAGIVRYYNAWLETPPEDWLKQHDAQLGIVHSKDGPSFPSTDGIYERNELDLNTREFNGISGQSGEDSLSYMANGQISMKRGRNLRKYLKNSSSTPSLDIVFEGSGSIRLESENNTEKTNSIINGVTEHKSVRLPNGDGGDNISDSEDSDFIQFAHRRNYRVGNKLQTDLNQDDISIGSHLTEPFSSSSSSGGSENNVDDDDDSGDHDSSLEPKIGSRARLNQLRQNNHLECKRRNALMYQKEMRQLENATKIVEKPSDEKVYLYIQMQLCRKDTLKDWLKTNCEHRDKTTIFDIFYQIVDAVEYVHSQDLIHRDLKPSNIFFSLDGTLKIGDFGLCRAKTAANCIGSSLDLQEYVAESDVERGFEAVHTEQVGTQLYMSPEQLNGLCYNQKVDIFAMGLILLELLCPFKTQMQRVNVLFKARNNLYSDEFKREFPKEHELVKQLLSRSPQKRPAATEIKQHELLASAQLSQPVIERIYHRRRTISSNSSTE